MKKNCLRGVATLLAALGIGFIAGACQVAEDLKCSAAETVYWECVEAAEGEPAAQKLCEPALAVGCGTCYAAEVGNEVCLENAESDAMEAACGIHLEYACKEDEGDSASGGGGGDQPLDPKACPPEWPENEMGVKWCACQQGQCPSQYACDDGSNTCQPDKDQNGVPDDQEVEPTGGQGGSGGNNETDGGTTTGGPDDTTTTEPAPTTGPDTGEIPEAPDYCSDPGKIHPIDQQYCPAGKLIGCSGWQKLKSGQEAEFNAIEDCENAEWLGEEKKGSPQPYCDDGDPGEGDFGCEEFQDKDGVDCGDCEGQNADGSARSSNSRATQPVLDMSIAKG